MGEDDDDMSVASEDLQVSCKDDICLSTGPVDINNDAPLYTAKDDTVGVVKRRIKTTCVPSKHVMRYVNSNNLKPVIINSRNSSEITSLDHNSSGFISLKRENDNKKVCNTNSISKHQ